jgi:hypothetical protein
MIEQIEEPIDRHASQQTDLVRHLITKCKVILISIVLSRVNYISECIYAFICQILIYQGQFPSKTCITSLNKFEHCFLFFILLLL